MEKRENRLFLRYRNHSFPAREWEEFLKYFGAAKYTGRSEEGFWTWRIIRQRGFHIWLSDPVGHREPGGETARLVAVVTNQTLSEAGREYQAMFIHECQLRFPPMEAVEHL